MDGFFIYDSAMVLHCLSAKIGKTDGQVDVIDDHDGENIMWKNASSPLLVDDLVIIGGGGKNQSLIAFNQITGKSEMENRNRNPHSYHSCICKDSWFGTGNFSLPVRTGFFGTKKRQGVMETGVPF